ncbi:hypothetical protein FRC12_017838 [Ceratobasidium sp. 428]|nr:hypothetical protein FRC12_017838 [Ceratobasidium sp. 428]
MKDKRALRMFEDTLRLELAILEPFARSVKCLESSASTPADVCLFWLASQATLQDLFLDDEKCIDLGLDEDTKGDIRAIANGRCSEVLGGPTRRMYITTLLLDPVYLGSTLFTKKNINPLATTIHIPPAVRASSSKATPRDVPDLDLRDSMPVYVVAGGFLIDLLVQEANSGRLDKLLQAYASEDALIAALHLQYMNYVRQNPPFDQHEGALSTKEYWEAMSRHYHAQILARLALKLYSVVPNSMAEERTVSVFTKMNSKDRARQKTSTLVQMTQIKQHEQRAENLRKGVCPIAPTVRFRDMSDMLQSTRDSDTARALVDAARHAVQGESTDNQEDTNSPSVIVGRDEETIDPWDEEDSDGERDWSIQPSRDEFQFGEGEGVNLRDPSLLNLLSDKPVPGAILNSSGRTNTTENVGNGVKSSKPIRFTSSHHVF